MNTGCFDQLVFDGGLSLAVAPTPDPAWTAPMRVGPDPRYSLPSRGGPDPAYTAPTRQGPDPRFSQPVMV